MGPPSRGARRGDILDRHPARSLGFVLQHANQCVQVGSQLIFASEMGDHALLDFLALAHRLDQTQVLMTTIGGLDRAKEHTASCGTTYTAVLPHIKSEYEHTRTIVCHYTFLLRRDLA